MIAQNEINRQKGLENETDNHTVSDKHHKGRIDCTIIRYPKVGVKHTLQVYVISELKIKLLCFFTLPIMVSIFIGVNKKIFIF